MPGPNYDLTLAWQENINKVRDKPLARKKYIEQLASRTGMSFEVLWYNHCTDDLSAVHFAKDPRKQNAHEKIAANWIKNIPGVQQFKKLKANGEQALYISQGRILSAAEKDGIDTPKSLDFSWEIELPIFGDKMFFYASHKHTGIDGGSQDNQFSDLKHFAVEASALREEKNIRFLSLADGAYYTKYRGASGTRLESLRAIANQSDYTRAMDCSELPAYLAGCFNSMFQALSLEQQDIGKNEFDLLIQKIEDYA